MTCFEFFLSCLWPFSTGAMSIKGANISNVYIRDLDTRYASIRSADAGNVCIKATCIEAASVKDTYIRDIYVCGTYIQDTRARNACSIVVLKHLRIHL